MFASVDVFRPCSFLSGAIFGAVIVASVRRPLSHVQIIDAAVAQDAYYSGSNRILNSLRGNCRVDSLWMNMGYIPDLEHPPSSYSDAGKFLARLVGQTADLYEANLVVDVGNGFADQDMLFVKEFGVKQVHALNIATKNVEIGQERIKLADMQDSVQISLGDAIDLSRFSNNTVDRIVALESAMHFDPRATFFAEAFRVLKIGGKLTMTDLIAPDVVVRDQVRHAGDHQDPTHPDWIITIPKENILVVDEYKSSIAATGFQSIDFINITSRVYGDASRPNTFNTVLPGLFGLGPLFEPWPRERLRTYYLRPLNYFVVSAVKK